MRALLRLVVTQGTGRKADAPGYRVGGKTGTAEKTARRPLYHRRGRHELRGCVPDGRAALCDGDDARRSQGDRRNLRLPHRGVEHRPGVRGGGRADRADARRPPDKNREPDMSSVLPFVHDTHRRNKHRAPARHCGRRQRFRSHGLCHRPSQGRAGSVFGAFKGAVFNGEDFIPAAVDRGAVAVVARPEAAGRSACRISPTPSRDGCSPSSPANFFAPYPDTDRRGDRDQRQDLDGRDDPPDLAHDRPPLGLDRDARGDHVGRPGQDRPDHARHRHFPVATWPGSSGWASPMSPTKRPATGSTSTAARACRWTPRRSPTSAATISIITPSMDAYFEAKMRLFDELLPPGRTGGRVDRRSQIRRGDRARTPPRPHAADRGPRRRDASACVDQSRPRLARHSMLEHRRRAYRLALPLIGAYQAANVLVAAGLVMATGGASTGFFGDAAGRRRSAAGSSAR